MLRCGYLLRFWRYINLSLTYLLTYKRVNVTAFYSIIRRSSRQ